jgi:integration host factor subunit beta
VNKYTKADIIDAIYSKCGMARKDIQSVADLFLDEIKAALVSDKVIELRGFGTFAIKVRKGRQKARNPRTGENLSFSSHGIAAFKPGRELKRGVRALIHEGQAVTDEQTGTGEGA